MLANIRNLLIIYGAVNVFTLFATSQWYTRLGIQVRNYSYYFLFRRQWNLERAHNADEIARLYLHWLRPIGFAVANIAATCIAYDVFVNHRK